MKTIQDAVEEFRTKCADQTLQGGLPDFDSIFEEIITLIDKQAREEARFQIEKDLHAGNIIWDKKVGFRNNHD